MQETKTIRVKKCPYCFRNISNEDAGFLLRTDGVRFQSPALNEVFSYKQTYLIYIFGVPWESRKNRLMPEESLLIMKL